MKKSVISVITILVLLCVLSLNTIVVFCMPSLDRYKEYEANIIEHCETDDGFIVITDDGRTILEPKGEKNSDKFSYYMDNKYVKQVYKTNDLICVVTWNGEDADCMIYKVK